MGNGPFGPGVRAFGGTPLAGRVGPGGDTAVAVLATVLRFTVWVLIILAAVWIVREILRAIERHTRHPMPPPTSPALAELEMLYARGQVNRTDYLARRADLVGQVPPLPPS